MLTEYTVPENEVEPTCKDCICYQQSCGGQPAISADLENGPSPDDVPDLSCWIPRT